MTIDTIISRLRSQLKTAGHNTTSIPIELYLSGTQFESSVISVVDADQEFENSFDRWNAYIVQGQIHIDVSVKTNDDGISIEQAQTMRDDVITATRSSTYQIIIQRISKRHQATGHVQYNIDCIVQYPIVD